jgi:chromosome segregation ATPase
MMRRSPFLAALALPALIAVALAASPAQRELAAQDAPDKLKLLEERIGALESKVTALEGSVAESKTLVESCVQYLQAQAGGAKQLAAALDQVESEGFTAGQNFRSRELLLAGLRSWIERQQENLPSAAKKKEEGTSGRAGR